MKYKRCVMPKKITLKELKLMIEGVLSEMERPQYHSKIEFTPIESDERRPNNDEKPKSFDVSYVLYNEFNDIEGEISGTLKPYHSGRAWEYEFEPSWFDREFTEDYYETKWEDIEEEILEKFHNHEHGQNLYEDEEINADPYAGTESIDGKYASKKSIINKIYQVLKDNGVERIYRDEYWQGVKNLTNVLRQYGVDYDLQNAKYVGHMSLYSDSTLPTAKVYNFMLNIRDSNQKQHLLPLKVTCAFVGRTGTSEDNEYELTYVIEA